jgi:hypothetical protein
MAVQQSPISTPRAELGAESKRPGPFTQREIWVSMVYLAGLVTLAARITFYPWPNRSSDR